jgi:hypothetical protein
MNELLVSQIKAIFQKKGYRFFQYGDFNINLVFVRESNEFTNKFTDTLYCIYKEYGSWKVLQLPCSTKAGWWGGIFNPITVAGKTGTAVLVPNQYKGAYKFIDSYFGWLQYPYFHQIAPVKVWRDYDKDLQIDKIQQQEGLFGINIHRGGNVGVIGGFINNWSQGCLVMEEPFFRKLLPIIRQSVKIYGDVFTATLIERKDFGS